MDIKSKIILIAGPTASGKSQLAVKLAKKIKGEIVNADSMQVYKELKILTARPDKKEKGNIKHHLYGFQSVKKKFSTGAWLKLVLKKIKEIQRRKKTPILVGGTGLYFKVLTEGLVKIPNIPLKARNVVRSLHKKLGQKKFYIKLLKIDPLIKNRINPNDVQRSIRAYEVKKFTKISIFKWFKKTKFLFDEKEFSKFFIEYPREKLILKIIERVNKMFYSGAIKEVKNFNKLRVKKENTANKVIGVKEISSYLNKEISLNDAKDRIVIKTRQYAKRQSTWARGQMKTWPRIEPEALILGIKKNN